MLERSGADSPGTKVWIRNTVLVVGCASQKGGVAKSSLARLLAREFAAAGRQVLLADLDVLQATSLEWARRRAEARLRPEVPVERCENIKQALKRARQLGTECLIPRSRIAVALCRAGDAPNELGEAARYIREAGYFCLDASWPERAGYRRAHDEGRVATEARHPSLRAKARVFVAAALNFVEQQAGEKKEGKHAGSRG